MKKKWVFVLVMGVLALTGCANVSTNEVDTIKAEKTVEIERIKTEPERKSEIYGVVSKVIGNEVTVNIIEKDSENDIELTEEEKEAKRDERQSLSSEEKKAARASTTVLTNELVDIVIPVGTVIVSGSGTEDSEKIKLELLDINRGTTIKIWLFEGGEGEIGVAEYVHVLSN